MYSTSYYWVTLALSRTIIYIHDRQTNKQTNDKHDNSSTVTKVWSAKKIYMTLAEVCSPLPSILVPYFDEVKLNVACHTAGVTMFSDDISVTVLRCNAKSFADLKAETWRIQHGATSDHTMDWQTTQLPRHVRHHVHWQRTISLWWTLIQ